jgi:hypothetical protein
MKPLLLSFMYAVSYLTGNPLASRCHLSSDVTHEIPAVWSFHLYEGELVAHAATESILLKGAGQTRDFRVAYDEKSGQVRIYLPHYILNYWLTGDSYEGADGPVDVLEPDSGATIQSYRQTDLGHDILGLCDVLPGGRP